MLHLHQQDDERALRLAAKARAESLYASFTPSEKRGVEFGLFPNHKMEVAMKEGHDLRYLAIALLDIRRSDILRASP